MQPTGWRCGSRTARSEGTVLIKDIYPGADSGVSNTPGDRAVVGDTLFFIGRDPQRGSELWKTDGTEAGTVLVKEIYPGYSAVTPSNLTALNDDVGLFTSPTSDWKAGLWRSDGTEAGTVLVRRFAGGADESLAAGSLMAAADGTLFFRARSAEGASEIWKSDGSEAGTVRLRQFGSSPWGPFFAYGGALVGIGGAVYFMADDRDSGAELWKTDGTEAGTVMVKDVEPGPRSSSPTGLFAWRGLLYFTATDAAAGSELWRTDGTEAGTARVADIRPGPAGSSATARVALSDRLVLYAHDGVHGGEVWETDGTEAGTRLAADLNPGPIGSFPGLSPLGDHTAFIHADDGARGREPWAIDFGRPAAAVIRRHIIYGGSVSQPAAEKTVLLPGETPDFDNVSTYARGINALALDVSGLGDAGLSAEDFEVVVGGSVAGPWRAAPAPSAVSVSAGAGAGGSDRVKLTWPDDAVRNQWLRVTLKANAATGLATPDVFYVGHLAGETGDEWSGGRLAVTAADVLRTRRAASRGAADARHDFNRDGAVNALDVLISRAGQGRGLELVGAQGMMVTPAGADAVGGRPARGSSRRWVLDGQTAELLGR